MVDRDPYPDAVHEAGHYLAGRKYIGHCIAAYFTASDAFPGPFMEFCPCHILSTASSSDIFKVWLLASADALSYPQRAHDCQQASRLSGRSLSANDAVTAIKILVFLRSGDLALDAHPDFRGGRRELGDPPDDKAKIDCILEAYPQLKVDFFHYAGVLRDFFTQNPFGQAIRESPQNYTSYLGHLDELHGRLPEIA